MHASIFRFEGQLTVFKPYEGPCYRCLFPEPPPAELAPSCAEGGVLGVLPGIMGTLQATEALKLLLGIGEPLVGRLLLVDALETTFHEVALRRDPDCPVCGEHAGEISYIDYEQFCAGGPTGRGRTEVRAWPSSSACLRCCARRWAARATVEVDAATTLPRRWMTCSRGTRACASSSSTARASSTGS